MRAYLSFLAVLALFSLPATALSDPDTLWTRRIPYSENSIIQVNDAVGLSNGDFALTGLFMSTSWEARNLFVARISSSGDVIWTRIYSMQNIEGNAIVELPDSSLMIAGGHSTSGPSSAVLLVQLTSDGNVSGFRLFPGSGRCTAGDLVVTSPTGNFAVIGYRSDSTNSPANLWLLQCQPDGDTLWTRLINQPQAELGRHILRDHDGGFWIAGESMPADQSGYDLLLLKIDSLGNSLSRRTFNGRGLERCNGLFTDQQNFYLFGTSDEGAVTRGCMMKIGPTSPTPLWVNYYTNADPIAMIRGAYLRVDGRISAVGWSGQNDLQCLPWMIEIDANTGLFLASWGDGSVNRGQYDGILPISSGGSLVYGDVDGGGSSSVFLMRIAPMNGIMGTIRSLADNTPLAGAFVQAVGSPIIATTDRLGQFNIPLREGTYRLHAWGACLSSDTSGPITVEFERTTVADMRLGFPQLKCTRTSLNLSIQNHTRTTVPLIIGNTGNGPLDFVIVPELYSPAGHWLSVSHPAGRIAPNDTLTIAVYLDADTSDDAVYDYSGALRIQSSSCPDSIHRLPVMAIVLDAPAAADLEPHSVALREPYPNPFNPATTLTFTLPHPADIGLTVFNLTGQVVARLAQGRYETGTHTVIVNGSDWPSGFYIARFQSADFSATQKLLLLK